MTSYIVDDSWLRCPCCAKRLVFELGYDEETGGNVAIHSCLNCDYFELDTAWRSRVPVVLAEIGTGDDS